MKLIKFLVVILFVIPVFALCFILLPGCAKESMNGARPGHDEHASAVQESALLDGVTINVQSVGAAGDGVTDDTWAFQKAIDSVADLGGGTVYVPEGIYLVDADTSVCIKMRSDVKLNMVDTTRVLLVKPNALGRYNAIRMVDISNSIVKGGKIQGERDAHLGTTGEWGHGIAIYGCVDSKVIGTYIVDCWGDGISIAGKKVLGVLVNSTDCKIQDVVCKNNRRQGLSIGAVVNLKVLNSEFSDTHGTAPQCGIDVEPDAGGYANGVLIQNCTMLNNASEGILLYTNRVNDVTIKYCEIANNNNRGIRNMAATRTYIGYNNIHHNGIRGIAISENVDSITVVQNTLYENNIYTARPNTLYITGQTSETEKDMYVSPSATNVFVGLNIYK